MAKVTVAVATYNRAHLLSGLFSNILDQTYNDFDVVVVDDGSTDDTAAVLAEYAKRDRINVHSHSRNRGVGAAKDKAVSLATGDYIAFIDDDDRWLPLKLERQVEYFESLSDKYAVVHSGMKHFGDGGKVRTDPVAQTGDIFPEILSQNEIGFSSTMVRRESIEEVGGFDPELPRAVDWDLWIRLAKRYKFEGIDQVLVHRHVQEDSITADPDHSITAREMIREKYRDTYQKHPAAATQLAKDIAEQRAFEALQAGDRLEALRYRLRALRLGGLSLKSIGRLGLSILGPQGYRLGKTLYHRLRR